MNNKNRIIILPAYSITPLNETALLVSFENSIDKNINEKVLALEQAVKKINFNGFIETVPAYCSLAIFYDAVILKRNSAALAAFEFVRKITEELIKKIDTENVIQPTTITIPVYYNGVDLEYVAMSHHITAEEVIRIHTAIEYHVYMIGFLPGFAYMGKVDERIATPRLTSPRTHVKPGSVGIAGFQTGIYPLESPGGWQLIGQTPLKIFDPQKKEPCLLKAGDAVQFIAINKDEFEKLNEY